MIEREIEYISRSTGRGRVFISATLLLGIVLVMVWECMVDVIMTAIDWYLVHNSGMGWPHCWEIEN